MNVSDFPRAVRGHWRLVVAGLLLGVLVAAAVSLLMPTKYAARVSMYVSTPTTNGPGASDLEGAQLAQNRIKSYLVLVTSDRVMGEVDRRLNLGESTEQLSRSVTPSSPLDSVIIDVDVFDRSPARAAQIANAVGDVFPGVVSSIEPRATPDGPPVVQVGVIEPATVPTEPTSLSVSVVAALGLLAGLVLGIGAAILASLMDRTVRSADMLGALAGARVLASIPRDLDASTKPLVVRDDPYSPRAEAFRQLRTSLRTPDPEGRRRVVAVTSPTGADGTSTTVANLAVAAASLGGRVLVVDANLRRPCAAEILGGAETPGLSEVLSGRAPLDRAIQRRPGGTGLDLLSAGALSRNPGEIVGSRNMAALLNTLRARYDLILIDGPPVLPVTDTVALAPHTDGVVLQCGFGRVSSADVEAAVNLLRSGSTAVLGSVLTMVPRDHSPRRGYGAVGDDIGSDVPSEPARPVRQAPVVPDQAVGPLHGPVPPPHQPSGESAPRPPAAAAGSSGTPGPSGAPGPSVDSPTVQNLESPTIAQQPVSVTRGPGSNNSPRPGPKPAP